MKVVDTGVRVGPPPPAGGVIPLMITALVVGDANAPTCDVRTTAPNPGRATETPPDLETLALLPAGTYCAAALTKDVKSDPDGRRMGIVTLGQHKSRETGDYVVVRLICRIKPLFAPDVVKMTLPAEFTAILDG